jgi:hypothetical protein
MLTICSLISQYTKHVNEVIHLNSGGVGHETAVLKFIVNFVNF